MNNSIQNTGNCNNSQVPSITKPSSNKTEKIKRLSPVKSKEAEDIQKPARVIKPVFRDLEPSKIQKTKKEEITNRSGEIWECFDRKPNKLGGYIYSFKMRSEYKGESNKDARDKKGENIYPAAEPQTADEVTLHDIHIAVGYSVERADDDTIFNLPDKEALMANWEKLRETQPKLPPLNIIGDEGIADDITFAEAYFTHDVLFSNGKEFFHDSIAHIMSTLSAMTSSNYKELRTAIFFKLLLRPYRTNMILKKVIDNGLCDKIKLQNALEKLQFLLGYCADLLSNYPRFFSCEQERMDFTRRAWNKPDAYEQNYFQRRFASPKLSDRNFDDVWKEVKEIEAQFDANRKNKKS